MKIPAVANAMGYLGEGIIAEAMEDKIQRKPIRWQKWVAVAACLAVLVGLLYGMSLDSRATVVVDREKYEIWEYEGSFSLNVADSIRKKVASGSNGGFAIAPEHIYFDSVQEMRTTILEGKFTEDQLIIMQKYFSKNSMGEIVLFDLNNMCDIVLPEGVELKEITFYGANYCFDFQGSGLTGHLNLASKETLEWNEKAYNPERMMHKVVKVEEDPARNAKIYYIEGNMGVRKHTTYTVSTEYGTFRVCECDSILGTDIFASIHFWGEYKGSCFVGTIRAPFKQLPSDWFQNFGLKPFVEEGKP